MNRMEKINKNYAKYITAEMTKKADEVIRELENNIASHSFVKFDLGNRRELEYTAFEFAVNAFGFEVIWENGHKENGKGVIKHVPVVYETDLTQLIAEEVKKYELA